MIKFNYFKFSKKNDLGVPYTYKNSYHLINFTIHIKL